MSLLSAWMAATPSGLVTKKARPIGKPSQTYPPIDAPEWAVRNTGTRIVSESICVQLWAYREEMKIELLLFIILYVLDI